MSVATLILGGVQTIATIEQACDRIRAAMIAAEPWEIDLSPLEEADLAFAQLLIAARKSAAANGISLTIQAPAESPIRGVFSRAGLDPSALLNPAQTGDQP